jgi:hypothetical protein
MKKRAIEGAYYKLIGWIKMSTYWNQMDKTWTHTHGIKWIIKEWKWSHMDNV